MVLEIVKIAIIELVNVIKSTVLIAIIELVNAIKYSALIVSQSNLYSS